MRNELPSGLEGWIQEVRLRIELHHLGKAKLSKLGQDVACRISELEHADFGEVGVNRNELIYKKS